MPMNNRILRPLARPLLLDAVPGAAAAYSLRQLSNAYTGPVVTVRRSSDNAEEDFKASEIDDGTLAAFCGAGDGLVKTWFDQSGNTGRDASQGTAASQPKIVDAGTVITDGGKPSLEFDGSNDYLSASAVASAITSEYPNFSAFCAANTDPTLTLFPVAYNAGSSTTNTPFIILYTRQTFFAFYTKDDSGQTSYIPATSTPENTFLSSQIINSSTHTGYQNGALVGQVAHTLGPMTVDLFTIGAIDRLAGLQEYFGGTISELIIYTSDQSANRQRIEGDIAWYY